jgi:hypothetical protein
MDPMSYQEFVRAYCNFQVKCDSQGRACRVEVDAAYPGLDGRIHQIRKSVALQPVIDGIAAMVKRYHEDLHRGMAQDPRWQNPAHPPAPSPYGYRTSGFGDLFSSIVKIAQRVSSTKAAQELYEQMIEHRRELADAIVPGSGEVLMLVEKAAAIVEKARDGDPEAIEKVAKVKEAADAGDPGSERILRAMSTLNDRLRSKPRSRSREHRAAGWIYNVPYRGPITAAVSASPGSVLRGLYTIGLGS